MRVTAKGQITIPRHLREAARLIPHTEVEFSLSPDGGITVRKVTELELRDDEVGLSRGEIAVKRLRESRKHMILSADELMALTRGDD